MEKNVFFLLIHFETYMISFKSYICLLSEDTFATGDKKLCPLSREARCPFNEGYFTLDYTGDWLGPAFLSV